MSDYITLLGAEDVKKSGHEMSSAAHEMQRSIGYLDDVLNRHQRFMDDWLQRFEAVLENAGRDKGNE